MPLAFPSAEFTAWVQKACTPREQVSISSGFMPDLGRYGVPPRDPDLFTLVQQHRLPSLSAIVINVFVWPQPIGSGLGRTRKIWFGVLQVVSGPGPLRGHWLVAKAWDTNPGTYLVAAEAEILTIAALEFP